MTCFCDGGDELSGSILTRKLVSSSQYKPASQGIFSKKLIFISYFAARMVHSVFCVVAASASTDVAEERDDVSSKCYSVHRPIN